MKKILIAALSAALLLTGCSGSKKADTANTLTVGMECDYAPFNWTQTEKTDTSIPLGDKVSYADGYDVVIAKKLADALGKELVIKKIAWTGLEPALNSGEIDAIIAGMTDTPERRQNADFTKPYYESDMVIIVRGDDAELGAVTDIQQLSGKKVQGQKNTMYDEVIPQITGVQHMTPLDTYPLMIVALKTKEVDALTAELPVATGVIAANPDLKIVQFEKGKGFEADTSVSIAVKKGSPLLSELQGVLDQISDAERLQLMTDAVARQPANG